MILARQTCLTEKGRFLEKRWKLMRGLIIAQVLYLLLFDGIFLSLPVVSKMHYLTDIVTLLLACGLICDCRSLFKLKGLWIMIPLVLYTIVCVGTAIANHVEFRLVLWAARNTFRFFVFFLACFRYLTRTDYEKFAKFLVRIQFVNFPLAVIETVYCQIFPKKVGAPLGDHVGGIFGMEVGCNSRLNIYLCLILVISLIEVLNRSKGGFRNFILICSTSMLCAAMAELKAFFFEAVALFLICCVLYIRSVKFTTILKLFGILAVCSGGAFLAMYQLYPYSVSAFADYGAYEQGAANVYMISRTRAFSQINEMFFKDSIWKRLFGFGFGNCEYASYPIFTSDFYNVYGYLNYRWFSHQMLYLETGAVGFIAFSAFFVVTALQALLVFLRNDKNRAIAAFSVAISTLLLANLLYNNCIRSDFAYVSYLCLAAVPVLLNTNFAKDDSERKEGIYDGESVG